ncbi:DDE-type integrase/transposase/recombinase [Salisediminibacterium beveridgei]|nr:DDE-type integrase/transposase/recombinase [Salisediminibacterium beveridgei]
MDRFMVYVDIHRLYRDGFSKSAIAAKLQISRNRVIDYLKMDPDEFEAFLSSLHERRKKLDPYQDQVVMWLNEHPDLSAAQIYDWLQEKAGMDGGDASENTVRNYVNDLRDRYSIPKVKHERPYGSVEELPMGQQGQVDFGQTVVNDQDGKRQRIFFIAFILSCSRYKYIECLDRPFRTEDVVHAHERSFQYFEGMPKEIVYDQDALLF